MVNASQTTAGATKIVAIVNPATRRKPEPILHLLRSMAPPGTIVEIYLTRGAGTTTDVARAALDGASMMVAVGGDGTVAAVASAIDGSGVPLAIIPAGSTNIIARELRIPTGARAAIELIYGEHAHQNLDLGVCGDQRFLHMAGAGFDSRLFAATNPKLKRRAGWLAYLPAGARNLVKPPANFTIRADNTTIEVVSPLVIVANGGSVIAPGLTLYPGISKDDGLLDVLVFTQKGPIQVLRTLGRAATRGLADSPFVLRIAARRVELSSDPPIPIQLDGDVVTTTPAIFEIRPKAIHVVTP